MNQLIINDLSFCHDKISGIEGAGLTPINLERLNLERLNVNISVGVTSLVLTQFPDFAGTAFGAAAAISASRGTAAYAEQGMSIS
jgi:hypothetical protein